MAVTFVLGRAGTGKTYTCIEAIARELSRSPEGSPLVLLVPEQASFQMERALATRVPTGGYTRAAVLSFTRLAQRVFNETGPEPRLLTPQTRGVALHLVVAQRAERLRVLARAARRPGFCTALGRIVEQLVQENITPGELRAAAERTGQPSVFDKVDELAELYAGYLEWLGSGRIDPAARLAVLRERLPQVTWLRDASVWVDGFAGFTGQELETLVELARLARAVTITLLVDPHALAITRPRETPDELSLFYRTELTWQRLLRRFEEAGVVMNPPERLTPPVVPRFAAAEDLARLEAGLAGEPEAAASDTCEGTGPAARPTAVRIVECPTHRDELRAAARWIRAQIADSGGRLRFRDFALIARDLEPFVATIAEVFGEYDIPYFLDRRRPMRVHPLARLLPELLAAARTDLDPRSMVRLLRTRLLPVSRAQAEELESLVLKTGVRGAELWRKERWSLDENGRQTVAWLPQRVRIVEALEPLRALARRGRPEDGATWARALGQVLAGLRVRRRVEGWIRAARRASRWESAETHRLAWEAVCSILEDLHAVLGATKLTVEEVSDVVNSALAEVTLGMAPPTVDQVLVSAIERSRHPDIRYAWVFAFNEGIFPARAGEDLILSTAERQMLEEGGLPALPSRRQDTLGERLLAYIALTRPSLGLTISYATVDDNGDALPASSLLADVRRALPSLAVERPDAGAPPVCLHELAGQYLRARRDPRYASWRWRCERVCEWVRRQPGRAVELEPLLAGLGYRNAPEPIGNYRQPGGEDPGVVWRASPSEIEKYLRCPFQHFARHGLRLDPQRAPRPVRWDLGELAHDLLARVTRQAVNRAANVAALSDEDWCALLQEAANDFWSQRPADLQQRRPDLVELGKVLGERLRDLVLAHAARWRRGRFTPWYCEEPFDPHGEAGSLRAVELTLRDGGRVHVCGRIDRVDVAAVNGRRLVLVYDYKSTVNRVSGTYLIGDRLQVFLYLLALTQALRASPDVVPAGVLIAPLYPDLDRVAQGNTAAEASVERMNLYRPRGLFSTEAAALLDLDHRNGASPVAHMRRRKDGGYYDGDDAVAPTKITDYVTLASRTALVAAEGVAAGRIDVAPLLDGNRLACATCDFATVCRFDWTFNRPRAAEQALPCLSAEGGNDEAD